MEKTNATMDGVMDRLMSICAHHPFCSQFTEPSISFPFSLLSIIVEDKKAVFCSVLLYLFKLVKCKKNKIRNRIDYTSDLRQQTRCYNCVCVYNI